MIYYLSVLLASKLSYRNIILEKWQNFLSASSGKNLKYSSLLLSFDKNGCQSEDVFGPTFFLLHSTQLTWVNQRYIQHVSFTFTLYLLTIHIIKHHISSTFFPIIDVLLYKMHKDLIIFIEGSIFFCFGCIRRSFKNLWP